jgi:hypothetical protein
MTKSKSKSKSKSRSKSTSKSTSRFRGCYDAPETISLNSGVLT